MQIKTEHKNPVFPLFVCLFVYFTVIFSYPTSFLGIVSIVLFMFVYIFLRFQSLTVAAG